MVKNNRVRGNVSVRAISINGKPQIRAYEPLLVEGRFVVKRDRQFANLSLASLQIRGKVPVTFGTVTKPKLFTVRRDRSYQDVRTNSIQYQKLIVV